jgi:hypothetical protein
MPAQPVDDDVRMSARRSLLAALIALLAAAPGAATAAKHKPKPLKCNGSVALCKRTFDRGTLAATHNSMSAASSHFGAPNQQVGIPQQLTLGIRGFLIDTYEAHRQPDGSVVNDDTPTPASSIFLCHVSCAGGATPFSDTLKAMASFLEHHPREVLLIDNEDHAPAAAIVAAVTASPLAHYLYRGSTTHWPTLATMIKRHQQVVFLAEQDGSGAPWYHPAYTGIVQETPYDWPDETLLTDPAKQPQSCVPNRGATTGSLFLLNHWSPPFPASPDASARVNATSVIVSRVRTCAAIRGKVPTIVAVDMVRSGNVVAAVRQINAHPPSTKPAR